ncbi:glycylpeptide N-tetradecanoyltransferase, partial [Mortierella alpina]
LRSKRLAPVLIKEVTRRTHLEGIFQAVYTAGVVLPKPMATCRYNHRSLNPKKLITDFFSFYSLPSTVINNPTYSTLNAAYSYYYAVQSPSDDELNKITDSDERKRTRDEAIKDRLNMLMQDALILARRFDFDVFNALNLMDNELFTENLKFGPGDGYLHYYLYNWRCREIEGHKVGLVML